MALPDEMTVVEISTPGAPEVLKPAKRPVPQPGAGEILIEIHYSGVNRPDAIQRAGGYPPPKGASDLPGLECAGRVAAVGPAVSRWKVGDHVCALLPGGGYAEYAVTPADHALAIPAGMSMREAAALPETFFTVWSTVFMRGGLQAGEKFLVHGGSSGIGTTAIQLASHFGARVFTTAGSAEKCAKCLELGAEKAINYRDENWFDALKDEGANLILDMVGGDYIAQNINLLDTDGRLVLIAFLQGPKAEVNFAHVMRKRLTVTGATLRPQSDAAKAAIADQLREKVWPLLDAGRIAPVMDEEFSLADAAEAHARMEGLTHIGKITLKVR
ncbi:NAD(P)H-quinone oxidoreductase [Paracoccaceae bacterium GXU_MW_L88]